MTEQNTSTTPAAEVQAVPVQAAPATLPGNIIPLWTVADVARFLARSERWVWDALAVDPNKAGSVPFIRIPGGRGSRGQGSPRFLPADVVAWTSAGCPPAAVFRSWQEADRKNKRKTA
ncbi:MAG TPA: hypothetical protein VGP72_03820 [Planctomycetota bacterium]|jgi:hypothetical protein